MSWKRRDTLGERRGDGEGVYQLEMGPFSHCCDIPLCCHDYYSLGASLQKQLQIAEPQQETGKPFSASAAKMWRETGENGEKKYLKVSQKVVTVKGHVCSMRLLGWPTIAITFPGRFIFNF